METTTTPTTTTQDPVKGQFAAALRQYQYYSVTVLPLPSVCQGGKVFGSMDGFGCRLGLPIDLPRPYKAHSLVKAASAGAFIGPRARKGGR